MLEQTTNINHLLNIIKVITGSIKAQRHRRYNADQRRKFNTRLTQNRFDTISKLINGIKRDVGNRNGMEFNNIRECDNHPNDIIRMLTEMRDKTSQQNESGIGLHGLQQPMQNLNYQQPIPINRAIQPMALNGSTMYLQPNNHTNYMPYLPNYNNAYFPNRYMF